MIPQKLHRKIEKALQVEKNCLKDQIKQLKELGYSDQEVYQAVKGCLEWMRLYAPTIAVPIALQTYISCLKHPKQFTTDTY